ncbi:hypothetical protein V8E55_008907 [Tylopilus felleus]
MRTTLGGVRGFLDDQIDLVGVANPALWDSNWILHRDINENNLRGYLISFDMTILQDVEEPTLSNGQLPRPTGQSSTKHSPSDETKELQGLRTMGCTHVFEDR